jgi:predicted Zn-dependent protease
MPDATLETERLQSVSTLLAEMGHLLTLRGALPQARTVLEGLAELEPDLAICDVLAGGLEVAYRDFVAAESCFRKALGKEPTSDLAKASLAEALLLQKRFREGEKLLAEVIDRGTDQSAIQLANELGQAIRRGDFQNV